MKFLIKERKRTKAERMVHEALEHKPETWMRYEHEKGGLFEIINMEVEELAKARSEGSHEQLIVALSHVAAAAQHALNKMTCP